MALLVKIGSVRNGIGVLSEILRGQSVQISGVRQAECRIGGVCLSKDHRSSSKSSSCLSSQIRAFIIKEIQVISITRRQRCLKLPGADDEMKYACEIS